MIIPIIPPSDQILDFARNAPDVTVAHAYRAEDYTAGNWPDRVGSEDLTQGTGGNQPTAVSDGGSGFSNRPVVRFDGSNDYLQNTNISLSQPHWVVFIGKLTQDNATNKYAISGGTTHEGSVRFNSSEIVVIASGAALSGSSSLLNSSNLILGEFNGASSRLFVNSILVDSGSGGTDARGGLTVGAFPDGTTPGGMDVAEVIVGTGTWTAAALAALTRYCTQHYGFAAPFPQTSAPTETSFSSAATSHAVSMPTTVNAGDLLRVIIQLQDQISTTITTPAGWTKLWEEEDADHSGGANRFRCARYAKVADGTEGGTTVDFVSSSASSGAAQCHRTTEWYGKLSGVSVGTPVSVNDSTFPNAPSLTPPWGSANTLWSFVGGCRDDDETISSFPTNYSGGVDTVSGAGTNAGSTVFSANRELAASSENPGVAGLTGADAWCCNTEAVRPIA